jgi:UDP-GlcNAc:undecaprenyl-phosphate GlcNAc-1-phosphate transferase
MDTARMRHGSLSVLNMDGDTHALHYGVVLLSSFIIAWLITPVGQWLGIHCGLADRPGGRRQHHKVISRTGGLGIVAGFFGAILLSYGLSAVWPTAWSIPTADPHESLRLKGVIIGGLWMFCFGLLDDYFELPSWLQYLGYLLSAIIATVTLIILERFHNPFNNQLVILSAWLYVPMTLFWITGMVVTVNWLDGLDGLAAGVAVILSATLAVHMIRMGQYSVAPQALALLGASLGFLVYNVPPAKVFMGSNGAFFLGYLLGALGLVAGARVATVLLVMGLPIVDVAWTIIARVRHKAPPSEGDRRHLHYRLQDAGFSTRAIVFFYWGFCGLFGLLALFLSSRFYKLLALTLLGGLTLVVLLYLSRKGKAKD